MTTNNPMGVLPCVARIGVREGAADDVLGDHHRGLATAEAGGHTARAERTDQPHDPTT
jgi:hypothetical protein